jgi:hypothetical protein
MAGRKTRRGRGVKAGDEEWAKILEVVTRWVFERFAAA